MKKKNPNTQPVRAKRNLAWKLALAVILLLLLAAGGTLATGYYLWAVDPLPVTHGEIKADGLRHPVTVARDRWGIPYLQAESDDDLHFAQGYVTAQDRLWQMDLLRRASAGELSELFGKDRLESDRRQRNFGFRQVAEVTLSNASPESTAALDAYARGVNAYIETHSDHLPLEFHLLQYKPRPWTPVDSLLIGKLMAQVLSSSWERDVFRGFVASQFDAKTREELLPETSEFDQLLIGSDAAKTGEKPASASPAKRTSIDPALFAEAVRAGETLTHALADLGIAGEMAGSNNWVIGPQKSVTGKPILANDPHLAHAIPSIWYLVSLRSASTQLHAAGVAFPGIPGIAIGHNERIAWGVTNFWADVQDLYVEQFDPEHPAQYRNGNAWQEAILRKEVILVRRSLLSGATDAVEHNVVVTRHGPIIAERGGKKLALQWNAFSHSDPFIAFSKLVQARNWEEFTESLSRYPGPTQNFVYADVDGNIGYYVAGHIPIRKSGDGSAPYDGATDDGEWTGVIPFDAMPHVYNPSKGWAATANNRLVGSDYPYFISHEWVAPYREKRINDLIAAKEKLSAGDVRDIQADVYSIQDHHFAQMVSEFLAKSPRAEDPKVRDIRKALDAFDGWLKPDSLTAVVPYQIREKFAEAVLRGKLGEHFSEYLWFNQSSVVDKIVRTWPREWLPEPSVSYEDLLISVFDQTQTQLADQLGSDHTQWRWGRFNSLVFRHPLGMAPGLDRFLDAPVLEMGGASHTVNSYGRQRSWGVSMRLIVDLANLDKSSLNATLGESGQVASEHYRDQLKDWHDVRPHLFPFSDEAVKKAAIETLILKP